MAGLWARTWWGLGLSAVVIGLGAGCQYGSIRSAQGLARAGEAREARRTLAGAAEAGIGGPHEVLGWLEWGMVLHETGAWARSSEAFLSAEAGFDAQDRRARTSISEELWAAATNPQSVAYRGSATDRVLAPTYRGLNALFLGDLEGARLAFNEAAIRQGQTVEARRGRIEAARAARAGGPYEGRVDLARSAEAVERDPAVAGRYASLARFEAYRDFVNPFSELVHGVFRLGVRGDAGDADRALALLRSVAGMVPENGFVAQTLADAEVAVGGGASAEASGGVTHVFFATGFGPWRERFRVDLPLFLVNDEVDYVGVSFPELVFSEGYERWLTVESVDGLVRTEVVADMDRLVAVEFREELPVLITRAVIGAASKIAASWGLNRATEDDETLNTVVRIAAGLYLLSQNQADTRSWATLPKQFQYARLATPESGEIRLSVSRGEERLIRAEPGATTVVFVRSTRPGVPLRVETVVLGEGSRR